MGHGGQTDIAYHGGGQAGEQGGDAPNAVAGSDSSDGWSVPASDRALRMKNAALLVALLTLTTQRHYVRSIGELGRRGRRAGDAGDTLAA